MYNLNHYYEILGIEPGASPEDIKQAYRDLVKIWHPDRFTHDKRLQIKAQEMLKKINEAYERLQSINEDILKDRYRYEAQKQEERPSYQSRYKEEVKDTGKAALIIKNYRWTFVFVIIVIVIIISNIIPLKKDQKTDREETRKSISPIEPTISSPDKEFKQIIIPLTYEVDLEKLIQGEKNIKIKAADGVLFTLEQRGSRLFDQRMVIFDKGKRLKEMDSNGYFSHYLRFEANRAIYWAITEFTGGAHCCTVYHLLAKSENNPMRYLGKTTGMEGGPGPLRKNEIHFDYEHNQILIQASDNRFYGFHSCGAASRIFFPIYYSLTPNSFTIGNDQARRLLMEEISKLENEIKGYVATSKVKPIAIIDNLNQEITDELGQLLVLRTVLYIVARDENTGINQLAKDVEKYYNTTNGLTLLIHDIKATMAQSLY